MGDVIEDTLRQLVDTLQPSKEHGDGGPVNSVAIMRRALEERRSVIEVSENPAAEILSTLLAVARSPAQTQLKRGNCLLTTTDTYIPYESKRSPIYELVYNQISAMTDAQMQNVYRQSPVSTHAHPSPRLTPDVHRSPAELSLTRLGTSITSEVSLQSDARVTDYCQTDDGAKTDINMGTVTPCVATEVAVPEKLVPSGEHHGDPSAEASSDKHMPLESPPKPLQPGNQYLTLSQVKGNMTKINLYVVAVEMIRAVYRDHTLQRDILNYRAVDPSVYMTPDGEERDYSIQITSPYTTTPYHVNYGDIIRMKRVDAQLVVDKAGNRHINIIMTLKNHPSMRVWPNKECIITQNAEEQPSSDPTELESEALVIYSGARTSVTSEDAQIITNLRKWVRDEMKMETLTVNRTFLNRIAEAGEGVSDFVVRVLEVAPEPEINLVVSDSSSMAVVTGLSDIVVSNLMKSHNRIQPGEWIKLRSVQRLPEQYKRSNSGNYARIKASNYSCVTRLPQLSLPYVKPIPVTSPRSKRSRQLTRMKIWTEASRLNRSFPRKLNGSTGYLDRLLQFNCVEEGGFKKAPPTVDNEAEEGEIRSSQGSQ
ncbi:alpha telomere binding protein, putative [Babesia ovis]|uniref:Alpha telomere binding protein, putative n=1 Tax=Babesia ovis TaxID=5869 RepID=A0A9W5WW90_BABOV|nr:alpha telomere binding protein, putative [Babesia ovis]